MRRGGQDGVEVLGSGGRAHLADGHLGRGVPGTRAGRCRRRVLANYFYLARQVKRKIQLRRKTREKVTSAATGTAAATSTAAVAVAAGTIGMTRATDAVIEGVQCTQVVVATAGSDAGASTARGSGAGFAARAGYRRPCNAKKKSK